MGWPMQWTNLSPIPKENFDDWKDKTLREVWWLNDPAEMEKREVGFDLEEPEVLQSAMLRTGECERESLNSDHQETGPEGNGSGFLPRVRFNGEGSEASRGREIEINPLPEVPYQEGNGTGEMGPESKIIPRIAHGVAHRVDRLKAIGNGQVPGVVRAAWRIMMDT